MHIDLDVEPSRPVPDREAERPREPERRGHRREYDAREPHREFSDRVDGVVRDVAAFRAVAQADLIKVQFDGHSYVARHGIAEAERAGWIERHKAQGPKGGSFTVVVATPAGADRAALLWARAGREDQRGWSGAVKASDLGHECAVYRATCAAAEAERCRAAAELDLPIEQGKVLFPDAQIEYVNAAGRAGRCNVEVVSQHYASDTIRSKAAAGFQMYAVGSRAADFVRRALASGGGDRGRRGGRGGSREIEVFEI